MSHWFQWTTSAISTPAPVDLALTNVIDGKLIHVSSWYDNEMGYSARCVDLIRYIGGRH